MILRGKVERIGPWSSVSKHTPQVMFIDVGDVDTQNRNPRVSVHYRKHSYEPYKIYRWGQLQGVRPEVVPKLVDIIAAAVAYDQLTGSLDGFPEQEFDL